MENPTAANTITDLSIQELAFHAASTPMGTAISTATTSVMSVRDSVGSTRLAIRLITGSSDLRIEWPRSPRSNWPIHATSWTGNGLSRPSRSRMRSTSSMVASWPASTAAGSPGTIRSSVNVNSATTTSTGIVARSLRSMYAFNTYLPPDRGRSPSRLSLPPWRGKVRMGMARNGYWPRRASSSQ